MHLKKDDKVIILTGKDRQKIAKVLKSIPKKSRIIVEGVNVISRHQKPTQSNPEGGVVKKEASIHISNALLYCETCQKGVRTKLKIDR